MPEQTKQSLGQVKSFYGLSSETSWAKRYQSPYVLRRYFFRNMWRLITQSVKSCPLVLDAGAGDGVLSVLMALSNPGQRVVVMDISKEGVRRAREGAIVHGVVDRMVFLVGDAERLPFKDNSLPGVVSSHVLEHLPDFHEGMREIQRVLDPGGVGVVALPTCLNPSAMVLLGGDGYWRISKRTPLAFWKGLAKVFWALLKGEEGVQEGYAGHMDLPHVRRFPWRAVRQLEQNGLKVTQWMADSLLIPYLAYLCPVLIRLQQWLDEGLRARRFWRNFGVGVVMVVRKGGVTEK